MAMIAALVSLMTLGLVLGGLLGIAARFFAVEGNPLQAEIEAMFPGSQCGQCGFPGCRPYAEAIVAGEADINRCPPGGEATILQLADLLDRAGVDAKPEEFRRYGSARKLYNFDIDNAY